MTIVSVATRPPIAEGPPLLELPIMHLLELTLATPAENLALDEALLDAAEAAELPLGEVLRLWESPQPLVVIGRASRRQEEVRVAACQADGIPVLRRASGGGAIVAGPGCLMYAVVLSYEVRPQLRILDEAHRFVLSRLADAVGRQLPGVEYQGTSDLTWRNAKISGNSVRCKRTHFLYHGTLLYEFPLPHVTRWLGTAPRPPAYRAGRDHGQFVTNAPLDAAQLRRDLALCWSATNPLEAWPSQRTAALVEQRYSQAEWHERL